MQNFQQILTQAAQLKQHQLKKDRQGYQSLPQFIKSGLGYNKKYNLLRKQDFSYQYRISNKVKQQGNVNYKQDKIEQALAKYEQALSIFRYIQSKSYQNMKDDDLQYHTFDASTLDAGKKQKYQTHLCALYLNICSCLTKQNKKQDALYSAEQALKIRNTVKAHYKKAQVYLKYVNRDANDIKLGLLELKEAYSIEKNQEILKEMYGAKDSYEKEQQKSKNWFKFMFHKNKTVQGNPQQNKLQSTKATKTQQHEQNPQKQTTANQILQLQRAAMGSDQTQKFQQTKQKLRIYTSMRMGQQQWQQKYRKDFIKRHGSKIYSILKIYKYEQLTAEFRALLAKCLEKEEQVEKSNKACEECIAWLRAHPVDKISKYIQRYDMQTQWIKANRNKSSNTINAQPMNQTPPGSKVQQQQSEGHKSSIKQVQVQLQQIDNHERNNRDTKNKTKEEEEALQKYLNTYNREVEAEEELQKQRVIRRAKRDKNQKYITVAIILLLLLIRFLWA